MENQPRINDRISFGAGNFRITQIFDDDKFTDMGIRRFETVFPGQSDYFIIKTDETPFKYVTSPLAKAVILDTDERQAAFIHHIESRTRAVFLHALSHRRQQIASKLSDKIVKVWFIWGFDLYSKWPLFKRSLYEPETQKYAKKSGASIAADPLRYNPFTYQLFRWSERTRWCPQILKKIMNGLYLTPFYKTARRIDIVAPVIPAEYELVRSMGIHPILAPFTYGTLENLLGDKQEDNVLGSRNILVGNSTNPSNNHVDVFKKLSKLDLKDRKVYVPLSYGGPDDYKEFVIEKGREYLGNHFVPLTDFMPLERYNEISASCSILIFNHTRQQGVGNIIVMGSLGAKIFLNEKSTAYTFYRQLGIKLFSASRFSAADIEQNLSIEDWQSNRKIYFEHYSTNAVNQKARELLTIVGDAINKKQQ